MDDIPLIRLRDSADPFLQGVLEGLKRYPHVSMNYMVDEGIVQLRADGQDIGEPVVVGPNPTQEECEAAYKVIAHTCAQSEVDK